jgi:hypothetical protein
MVGNERAKKLPLDLRVLQGCHNLLGRMPKMNVSQHAEQIHSEKPPERTGELTVIRRESGDFAVPVSSVAEEVENVYGLLTERAIFRLARCMVEPIRAGRRACTVRLDAGLTGPSISLCLSL